MELEHEKKCVGNGAKCNMGFRAYKKYSNGGGRAVERPTLANPALPGPFLDNPFGQPIWPANFGQSNFGQTIFVLCCVVVVVVVAGVGLDPPDTPPQDRPKISLLFPLPPPFPSFSSLWLSFR